MLTAVMLGQDSTGQRITFLVIGLLLAALALAILTAWYYRVTDPGPKRSRQSRGSNDSPGGGTPNDPPRDPKSGPGWRKRLSGFDVPDADAKTGKEAKIALKAQKAEAKAQSRADAVALKAQAAAAAAEVEVNSGVNRPSVDSASVEPSAAGSESYLPEAPPTVSLEGGYYLDLTEVAQNEEPQTNVGSLNSLDLRQPAPLVDPHETSIPVAASSASQNPLAEAQRTAQSTPQPASKDSDGGVSFDDWLADAEAIQDTRPPEKG